MGDMASNGVTTITLYTTNNSIPRNHKVSIAVFVQGFKCTFTLIYFFIKYFDSHVLSSCVDGNCTTKKFAQDSFLFFMPNFHEMQDNCFPLSFSSWCLANVVAD